MSVILVSAKKDADAQIAAGNTPKINVNWQLPEQKYLGILKTIIYLAPARSVKTATP